MFALAGMLDCLAGDSHLWNTGFQLGDWLDPTAPPDDPTQAMTDPHLVASAYFVWSDRHLAKSAAVLGKTDDELRCLEPSRSAAKAFARGYTHMTAAWPATHRPPTPLATIFDLFPDDATVQRVGQRLAQLVREGGNRIGTGFAGTPLVSDALTAVGEVDTPYDLLLEKECPSWLYAVAQGGTTIWER